MLRTGQGRAARSQGPSPRALLRERGVLSQQCVAPDDQGSTDGAAVRAVHRDERRADRQERGGAGQGAEDPATQGGRLVQRRSPAIPRNRHERTTTACTPYTC